MYTEARRKGILFIRYDPDQKPETSLENGRLTVCVKDPILDRSITLRPDLLVLVAAILPNKYRDHFGLFKVPANSDGFLVEAHAKLRPVDFASEGIFMAGLAHGPKSKIIQVPCTGCVDVLHLMKAMEDGADGIYVAGCMEGGIRELGPSPIGLRVNRKYA